MKEAEKQKELEAIEQEKRDKIDKKRAEKAREEVGTRRKQARGKKHMYFLFPPALSHFLIPLLSDIYSLLVLFVIDFIVHGRS
jgi:hypothetical protein